MIKIILISLLFFIGFCSGMYSEKKKTHIVSIIFFLMAIVISILIYNIKW